MTEARTSRRAQLPVSTEVIRSELKKIRGLKEGLSAETVIQHGRDLQRLRAVSDEMLRRDLPPGHRPDATARVVRCAVNHLVKDPWKTFLAYTLLDTGHQLVGDRVHRAGEALGIASDSQREVTDEKSYRDLARALVEAEGSPCLADSSVRAAALQAEIAVKALELADLLSDMSMDAAADAQRRAARLLNAKLPRGAQALAATRDVGARAQQLIEAAIARHGSRLAAGSVYLEVPLLLYRFAAVMPQVAGFEYEDTDDEEMLELQAFEQTELLRRYEEAMPNFEVRLESSILLLADALAYEERHGWPSLTEPRNSGVPRRP